MKHTWCLVIMMASALGLVGCASPQSNEDAFTEVASTVAERAGKDIYWDQGTPADLAVRDRIHTIVQSDLTVDAAVQIALLNNRSLQATYEDIGIAQAELVQAGLLKNPVLSAEIRFPAHPRSPLEIDVFQEILSFFYRPMRMRLAGAAFEAAKLRVTDAVLTTAAQTKAAFFTFQAAQQMVESRRRIAEATEAAADAATRLHEAGNLTDLQLAEERAMHDQAQLELADGEADAFDAREQLNALMGLWGDDARWTVASPVADLPERAMSADDLEFVALANRLDLAAARKDLEVMGHGLKLLRSSALVPEMHVGSHFEREPDGASTFGPSVELPLPIFDQGKAAVAGGQARLRQSQQRCAALEVQIRSEVHRAANRLSALAARARFLEQAVMPRRHAITQQTLLEYNGMLAGVFDLLHARQAEIEAESQFVLTRRDYWIAHAELERVIGGRFIMNSAPPSAQPVEIEPPASRPAAPATSEPDMSPEHHHHGG